MAVQLVQKRFAAAAVELNYAEGPPSGPPLVLLHGGGGRWQYLQELAEALATDWHVYVPDLRGHGTSGRVPGRYKLADYIPDVNGFIEQQCIGQSPVVYGHSMGGEVAVMLAARHPDAVRALIVGDAPLTVQDHATEEPEHRARNELWHSLVGKPVDDIERGLRRTPMQGRTAEEVMGAEHAWFRMHALTLHQLDPEMLAAVLAGPEYMLEGYEPNTLLPAIKAPTLLVQADPNGPLGGGSMRDAEVELALRLIPDARHVRIEGVGHPLNDVPKLLAALRPFLSEISASERRRPAATG